MKDVAICLMFVALAAAAGWWLGGHLGIPGLLLAAPVGFVIGWLGRRLADA
jgi:hypothetical protein